MATNKQPREKLALKGFRRVQIVEGGRVVGDSLWESNQIVNLGVQHYLTELLGKQANSKQISRMMLGTGGDPAATATTLPGELNTATYTRTTVSASLIGSTAVEFQATFSSQSSHITSAVSLSNVGIINDTTSAGTLFAGKAFISSLWSTNQSVQASYRINFTTTP